MLLQQCGGVKFEVGVSDGERCGFGFSGEGSQYSGNSDERNLAAMARAISVHPETVRVMYFA